MSSLLSEFLQSKTPETTFLLHLERAIEMARSTRPDRSRVNRRHGKPLFNPLMLGYNGAANTGADVRVIEILRQFRRIFGDADFDPVLLACGQTFDHAELNAVRKLHVKSYFPEVLSEAAGTSSGVITCEGSMFTSMFSDMLSGMFAGGLGYAAARGDVSVGYGAEVGSMTPALDSFVRSACADSLIFARNRTSLGKLERLGCRARPGADPAWSFEPARQTAPALLGHAGWDGTAPVVVLCPINPFHWPVVVDIPKATAAIERGSFDELQHDVLSFHTWSEEAAGKYAAYLSGFAELARWLTEKRCYPVIVGMQGMDQRSCDDLNRLLKQPLPIFTRGAHDIDDIVSLLHNATLIVSSRFHATVIGMAGGRPSIGVSMDSRIENLFLENDLEDWLLSCDVDDLGAMLIERASTMMRSPEMLAEDYGRLAAGEIRAFGEMGLALRREVEAVYPDFSHSRLAPAWDAYLPPLSGRLEKLLERYSFTSTYAE